MSSTANLEAARVAVLTGNKRRARELLRQILAEEPRNAEAWELFADVAQRKEHAIESLTKAVSIDPNNTSAREKLATLTGRLTQARTAPAQSPTAEHTIDYVGSELPFPVPQSTDELAIAPGGTKRCPYCAETIKVEAVVCRYCGRDLVAHARPPTHTLPASKGTNWGAILLVAIVGVFGTCLCLYLWSIGALDTGTSGNTVYAKDFVVVDGPFSCRPDSIGNMWIKGSVKNRSTQYTLLFVRLRGTVLRADGDVVNTNTSYIDSDRLGPGRTSTFSIVVDDPRSVGKSCRVEVESARFAND